MRIVNYLLYQLWVVICWFNYCSQSMNVLHKFQCWISLHCTLPEVSVILCNCRKFAIDKQCGQSHFERIFRDWSKFRANTPPICFTSISFFVACKLKYPKQNGQSLDLCIIMMRRPIALAHIHKHTLNEIPKPRSTSTLRRKATGMRTPYRAALSCVPKRNSLTTLGSVAAELSFPSAKFAPSRRRRRRLSVPCDMCGCVCVCLAKHCWNIYIYILCHCAAIFSTSSESTHHEFEFQIRLMAHSMSAPPKFLQHIPPIRASRVAIGFSGQVLHIYHHALIEYAELWWELPSGRLSSVSQWKWSNGTLYADRCVVVWFGAYKDVALRG